MRFSLIAKLPADRTSASQPAFGDSPKVPRYRRKLSNIDSIFGNRYEVFMVTLLIRV